LNEEDAQYHSWTAGDWQEARSRRLAGESDLREGEGWAP
jgi:hypothetical protein